MSTWTGWSLALLGLVAGWAAYGWPGVVLAISVTAFWLLLQFSRVMRLLHTAGGAPKGQIDSAVLLGAKLRKGLRLMDVIALTRSLGVRVSEQPEVWRWTDAGDINVDLSFEHGRCASWTLKRPDAPARAC